MDLNTSKLGWKTKTFNLFRRVFQVPFIEQQLVEGIKKNPRNSLLRKLQPNNYLYHSPSVRKVNRWGLNFELDISDYQEWLIYFISEADSSFDLLNYLSEGDHVIDIGGNIGQTGLRMAQKVGTKGHVISFEPYPPTFRKYQQNLSLNPVYKSVIEVENMGLGTEEATMKMFKDCVTNSGGNRVLHNEVVNPSGLVDVKISTLDNYVQAKNISKIDFIKIDVEGFEFNVLKGARATLLKYKPRLYIELNDSNLKEQGGSGKELISFLENLSYKIIRVDTGAMINAADYAGNEHYDIYCVSRP